MERFAYLIKHRLPGLFRPIAGLARAVTVLRYGRRREHALGRATLFGTVRGQRAEIRPLRGSEKRKGTEAFFRKLAQQDTNRVIQNWRTIEEPQP